MKTQHRSLIAAIILFFVALGWSISQTRAAGTILTDPSTVVTPAALPLPAVGIAVIDPVFATTLRRVSNRSDSGGFETQVYSQLQAFSADNRHLLLTGSDGYRVVRVDNFSAVTGFNPSGWNAPRWHPADAAKIVHFDSNEDTTLRAQTTDVESGQTATIFTFPAPYERIRTNQSFDELSHDGRWLAGMASQTGDAQMIFALNLQTAQLGAQFSVDSLYAGPCEPDPQWGNIEPDWIGVSPLGRYLVIQWPRDGEERCNGLETFDIQSGAFVGRVYDGHQHGDLGVLPDGDTEFFMTFELYNPDANGLLSLGYRTLPGTSTVSPPVYVRVMDWVGAHISCQGPNGVCLVTAEADASNGWSALEGELFLQYTDGRIERLVHHRSSACGYWVQPRATISRDGSLIAFASDWGRADGCTGGGLGQGDPFVLDRDVTAPTATATSTGGAPTGTVTATSTHSRHVDCHIDCHIDAHYHQFAHRPGVTGDRPLLHHAQRRRRHHVPRGGDGRQQHTRPQ
ncbi:MAG: hypothetical protein R2856_13460 [Caldilineaceae bacterium]